MKKILILLTLFSFSCSDDQGWIEPFPLFSDHMVLQRDTTVAVWGWANPGSTITVSPSWGESNTGTADKSGKWITELKTIEAGGPYTLSISHPDTSILVNDVMLGEVWLASGQSNMSMPLMGWPPNDLIVNSEMEIAESSNLKLRMFTVERALSDLPESNVVGDWQVSSPETSGEFSATAYFFARELQQQLDVPIGVIHTSWGGTPVEAWTSSDMLENLEDFSGIVAQLEKDRPNREEFKDWLEAMEQIPISPGDPVEAWSSLDFGDEEFKKEGFDDNQWRVMDLPLLWEQSEIGDFDGVIWFRRKFQLNELVQGAVLHLGAIDDRDQTYVNGALVGEHMGSGQWEIERSYEIPDRLLKKGENVVAVRVMDTGSRGGIWGERDLGISTSAGSAVNLKGSWKYKQVSEYRNSTFYVFKDANLLKRPEINTVLNSHTPTTLYNAMIHPLIPYGIKGAIWYQGESNVSRAAQYELLFTSMIKDWRMKWEKDFSFYFVQIAPFKYGGDGMRSANLREAQRRSMSVPGTGMIVTLDIGNNSNIHPGNKQDVGKRLANWALSKDYQLPNVNTGPVVDRFESEGKDVVIYFKNTGDGLLLNGSNGNFEVSKDGSSFAVATVEIDLEKVKLSSTEIENIMFVRYAWKDTASATLFNSNGLPVSSFELSIE